MELVPRGHKQRGASKYSDGTYGSAIPFSAMTPRNRSG